PLIAVLVASPELPARVLAWDPVWSAVWLVVGLAVGVVLWAGQIALQRRGRVTDASPIWVGPPGRLGFGLLLVPVGCIVLAEELVWRGFLVPAIGLPLSSAAFALHHYAFGLRRVAFSFFSGLVWGGLFLLARGDLWPALASHLLYNALAWWHLRRQHPPRDT